MYNAFNRKYNVKKFVIFVISIVVLYISLLRICAIWYR